MNRKLLIVGAGGHGRVVADAASASEEWDRIAFIDSNYPKLQSSGGIPVINDLSMKSITPEDWPYLIVAVGNNKIRADLIREFESKNYTITTVAHPSAQISPNANIEAGTVCLANSVVNAGATIGKGVIINTSASVDHDCVIGEAAHVSPGVNIAGNVTIGARSWIGIGSAIINNCTIGKDAVVGAGSVVVSNIPDSVTAFGVPAKVVESK